MNDSTTTKEPCQLCGIHHKRQDEDYRQCYTAFGMRVEFMLKQLAGVARCRACDAPIYFLPHANGKRVPYTAAALNHFADCPGREEFSR